MPPKHTQRFLPTAEKRRCREARMLRLGYMLLSTPTAWLMQRCEAEGRDQRFQETAQVQDNILTSPQLQPFES